MAKLTTLFAAIALLMCSTLVRAAAPTTAPMSVQIEPTTLRPNQSGKITVTVDVPKGLHAQSHTPTEPTYIPFDVTISPNSAVTLGEPVYPKGERKNYPALGPLDVYEGRVVVEVPLTVNATAASGPLKLEGKLQYQMCDESSCFMPQHPKFEANATIEGGGSGVNVTTTAPAVATTAKGIVKSDWGIWTAFGAALLAGLLFNIMPCVLPVLPLKAAAFYRAAEHHRSRSFVLGLAFSVGIVAVFAVLAVLVLVLRVVSWGSLFSNPYFVWSLVILLIACALGLFGTFDIPLPTALYGVDPRQDTIGGNIVFGAFTAILATPCTAPLLPGLLIWASAKPAVIGVPAMLLVGMGMALPYLILSAFPEAAKKFPQTGPWAGLFKQMMGFLLLAAATYFAAGRLVHGADFWWPVTAVVAVAALYLIARTVQLTPNARPVGISAALAVAMLGGTLWWTLKITRDVGWVEYSDAQFRSLRDQHKPVLVKFTANWCGICQKIEGSVFQDPKVWDALKDRGFTAMKVDFSTDAHAPGEQLLLSLNPAGGIPLTAVYGGDGSDPTVLASNYSSAELLEVLKKLATSQSTAAAR